MSKYLRSAFSEKERSEIHKERLKLILDNWDMYFPKYEHEIGGLTSLLRRMIEDDKD